MFRLENDNRFACVCVCVFREILNEERCPGFLLEAVRSAIKKRRRVIKAKMLGIPVNDCSSRCVRHPPTHPPKKGPFLLRLPRILGNLKSLVFLFFLYSDDEERSSLFGSSEVDGTEVDGADKPQSRIRNL